MIECSVKCICERILCTARESERDSETVEVRVI